MRAACGHSIARLQAVDDVSLSAIVLGDGVESQVML